MRYSRSFGVLCACGLLLSGALSRAAGIAETIPSDSAVAKADPAWQRLLLSSLDANSKVTPGGQQVDRSTAAPADGVPAKFGSAAMKFSTQARSADSRAEYLVAQWVGGQPKLMGFWACLAAGDNIAKIGLQITDNEGESFACTVDANWAGWKWIEAEVTAQNFAPVLKPGEKGAKNGKIDFPIQSVRVVWRPAKAGPTSIVVDELVAVTDLGANASANPVSISDLGQLTLQPGGKLNMQAVLTNQSDKPVSAATEFVIQQDPALYSEPAPLPRYGRNIAVGAKSWFELDGKTYDIGNCLTDGKPWTDFGGPMSKDGWSEGFVYIDLGKPCHVVHMGRMGGNASRIYLADFAGSMDGKEYTPAEGLQNVNLNLKWAPQEFDVNKPLEARFIRLRLHNNGQKMPVLALPAEFFVYDGEKKDTWDFPQTGARLLEGKQTTLIPGKSFDVVELGDGRVLQPGSYLVALRSKIGDVTQMSYGRVLVAPAAMEKVTADSRFGMNGIGYPELGRQQGFGWVRFENLKWPKVSHQPGEYCFDGYNGTEPNFDDLFSRYRKNDLSIMPFLFLTAKYQLPKDGKPNVLTYPPVDMSKYGEFVYQCVARYGSKKHPPEDLLTADKVSGLNYVNLFELWNEADLNDPNWGSWRGVFNDFYIMYRYGAEAVKKADPDAKVANGGWSGMGVPLMESMRTYKYPDGKCPLDFTDVLSVHYYSFRIPPELATVNDNTNRNGAPLHSLSFEQELKALVAWRDKVRPTLPIWMSETGYDTGGPKGVDERLQACWLPRDIMMMLAAGVDKVDVFRETGSGGNLFSASGVIRDDGTLKPSWFTFATLIRQLDGVTDRPIKMVFPDRNIRAYLWKRGRGQTPILTIWAVEGTAKVDLPLGRCKVTDAFGNASTQDVSQPLELTNFPLYITDLSAPAAKSLQDMASGMAQRERERVERQSKLNAYLFEFGTKDRGATLVVGNERQFIDLMAGDLYDDAKGYGFVTKGLQDKNEAWLHPPFSVKVTPASQFTFKAKPGEYELQVSARVTADSKVLIKGVEGGDQTLRIAPSRDGATGTVMVKVAAKPVTLETSFNGELIWMSMVEVDQ